MDCKCIKGNYNFTLVSPDTKNLIYTDISDWMDEDYYIKPDTYTIRVKTPNTKSYKEITLNTTGPNLINTEDLGAPSGACLPDGVYCFSIKSCGNIFTRYKAVTADTECRLQCMLQSGIDPFKLSKLSAQIKTIHYNLERDMTIEANKIYKTVKKEIDLVECDCSCC